MRQSSRRRLSRGHHVGDTILGYFLLESEKVGPLLLGTILGHRHGGLRDREPAGGSTRIRALVGFLSQQPSSSEAWLLFEM